jgi:hypothetical protein
MSGNRSDRALDYVLGALSPAERAEADVARRYDSDLDAEIAAWEGRLGPLVSPAGEKPGDDLLERIETQINADAAEHADKMVEMAGEGVWEHYAEGVEAKTMWSSRTIMLRCRPGAVLEPHLHPAFENIVVIAGDLVIGGRSYGPGDYHGSPSRSRHGELTTKAGCLLLIQYAPNPRAV